MSLLHNWKSLDQEIYNLEARDRYCVERDVQRHKNYWARELVKRMIIPIFPEGSERVKKPEM